MTKNSRTGTILIALFSLAVLIACASYPDRGQPSPVRVGPSNEKADMTEHIYKPDQILVKFKKGVTETEREGIALRAGLEMVRVITPPDLYLFRLPPNTPPHEMCGRLQQLPEVEYAEPNFLRKTK